MAEKNNNHIAQVSKQVNASASDVWDALTSAEKIGRYMYGTTVTTDWQPGSEVTWEGEFEGKSYRDKGTVLVVEPEKRLSYSHFSSITGEEDISDNYHIVTIDLSPSEDGTIIDLSQDNNRSSEARRHAEENWEKMFDGLERVVTA